MKRKQACSAVTVIIATVVLVLTGVTQVARAQTAATQPAQTIWRLLDYIAVDYSGAVDNGRIVNQSEYDEMREFSATASRLIGGLPASAELTRLKREAAELEGFIAAMAPASAISTAARDLASEVISTYPVPRVPTTAPDIARGEKLYAERCAFCHGATGRGDGTLAANLNPPPIAFTDESRARERSVFALYQVIEQGLDGTSMASFADLPSQERWALAFYVSTFAFPEREAVDGAALWESATRLRAGFDLAKLTGATPATLEVELGETNARHLVAYLRRHPEAAFAAQAAGSLSVARTLLARALIAYEGGDRNTATRLALAAYLDGFEPVEPALSARDSGLMRQIESAMAELRAGIAGGESVKAVSDRVATLDALFGKAESSLAQNESSSASSFVASFTILIREGLEALLLVLAIMAFLVKADRRDLLVYVHGGWSAALVAGGATWALATWLVVISGASRELIEGFGGIFAALVLLWVGIWMHGKSHADAWQRYIREKLGRVLNRRSAWFLFALAFLVVYREVFETILFYTAIWSQGNTGAVVAGALAALALLATIAFILMRYSRSLPIGKFFAYSSALLSVLAVVLIGKGTAALQEAGYLSVTPWNGFPRSELLGIVPLRETILAQLAMIALLAAGYAWNRRSAVPRRVP